MSIKIIQERLEAYGCRSQQEEENALREISQEVVLAALSRTDFFKRAGFQGGTCLRVLYSLSRFSEDLDFILKQPDPQFALAPYLRAVKTEMEAYGYRVEVVDRSKVESAVKKGFLKDDSLGKVLSFEHLKGRTNLRTIRIKLEVDANPPAGSVFENRFLDYPFPFSVTVQDLPSLFAGKSHALLCREYTKGRDWYDFVWYTARKIPVNLEFLSAALEQNGQWKGHGLAVDSEWYIREMAEKIRAVDWKAAQLEVSRFLKPHDVETLQIWSSDFFLDRLQRYAETLDER